MELGEQRLRRGNPDTNTDYYSRVDSSDKNQERSRLQNIFDESITLATDWLEAAGGKPITSNQYRNLFRAGYVSHDAHEVLEVFYDWEDYCRMAAVYHTDRVQVRAAADEQLFQSLAAEREMGLLPSELFQAVERYTEDNPTPGKRDLTRMRLIDGQADKATVITRYHRYFLAGYLVKQRPSETELSEERRLNIALGFTIQTSKPLSSFVGSLKNSVRDLTEQDIKETAEEMGIYDYLFPASRKKHLAVLKKTAQVAEVAKDKEEVTSSLPELGQELEDDDKGGSPEVYFDIQTGKMLIGSLAVSAYMSDSGGSASDVYELGKLLVSEVELPDFSRPNISRKWSNEQLVDYGRWLMSLVQPHGVSLQEKVLRRAFQLGLGPSENVVYKDNRFSSLANFYRAVGVTGAKYYKAYDNWEFEDFVNHIKGVQQEIGRRPTRALLTKRIMEGRSEPSPAVLDKVGGLSVILEAAGIKSYNRKLDASQCVEAGVNFYIETGRLPTRNDIDSNDSLPSLFPIKKYCGGVKAYQKLILDCLQPDKMAV